MSMYRQIWLVIVTSTFLALGGSLLASVLSARSYLETQLSMKNADNASALALSLSRGDLDDVSIDIAVSAIFDSGHYEHIRVVDPRGRNIAERTADADDQLVPAWFVDLLPITSTPGSAQISDGWKQVGTITLISHSRFAYQSLWHGVLNILAALAAAGLVGGYLGTRVLRRLHAPLKSMIQQARAITERRFTTIDEPDIPELHELGHAMNTMTRRLRDMFNEEAARLESVRQAANCDALTGLANREHFMTRVREATLAEDAAGGVLFIARMADLATVNRTMGHETGDELLRRCGEVLREAAQENSDWLAGRLNGADIALLVPSPTLAEPIGERLRERLTEASARLIPGHTNVWLAGGRFPRDTDPAALLAHIDAALASAEAKDAAAFLAADFAGGDLAPHNAEQWSAAIQQALGRNWVQLAAYPVRGFDGTLMHRECPLRLRFDAEGPWLPAGRFIPAAERLPLMPQLDLSAITLALEALKADPHGPQIAVNLSTHSLVRPEFREKLRALIAGRPETARLWLEVSESGALAHFDDFRAFCLEFREAGFRLGIEHFGRHFSEIGRFYNLGLDYLKVDASFISGLDSNPGNQAFLRGLATIAHGIGMQVIAEGVVNGAELAALDAVGFDAATGPGVRD